MESHGHPNGPRTIATMLRDEWPLTPEHVSRLMAVEANRHPTLTEMRVALGLDLSLGQVSEAVRGQTAEAGWRLDANPTDEQMAAAIDAGYRAIASSRMIHARITSDAIVATRTREPIRVRGGEALTLFVVADNETNAHVGFSVEAQSATAGRSVEAGRTASVLLDAGSMQPGSYLLPVQVVAGEQTANAEAPIECMASGMLRVRIIDGANGEPVAARVYLRDELGAAHPAGVTVRIDAHGNAYFHADGGFEVRVCGTARIRVARGIESETSETEVVAPANGKVDALVRLERWSHMADRGWYSGDVHVHMHYGGEYLLEPGDVALVQRAEDVNFLNMMVANQGSGWVHDRERFEGADHELSDGRHILRWGEEYRNDFYGHMCMYGIGELVPPIYSGMRNSEYPHDLPANVDAARHCHAVGGTLSYAHPLFESAELDRVFDPRRRRSVEAKELPIDATLGEVDALDIMSYPGSFAAVCTLWYRLLNCGLRLAATAGTDTFMNFCRHDAWNTGLFSNPPAGDRVFARVEGAFTTEAWCEAVRAGRTFVSNAPMLRLAVDGRGIGDEIVARVGDGLRIEGEATSHVPMERLELIVDGAIVASVTPEDGGRRAEIAYDLAIEKSCWIAARATGGRDERVVDPEGVFGHTSPVYVSVAGSPVAYAEDAAYFVEWIERLIAQAGARGSYGSDAEREGIAAAFREGQAWYRRIAESGA